MATLVREKVDASRERMLTTLSIMDTEYLRGIRNLVSRELLANDWCWTVFNWCAEYFDTYGKAPEKDVQELYTMHRHSMEDNEAVLIAKFLHDLSGKYEPVSNIPYQIQQTEDYLTVRNATLVKDELEMAIEAKDARAVESAIAKFKQVRAKRSGAIDAINDDDAIIEAFTHEDQLLFRFDGAVGQVVGDFNRSDLVGFQAFSKIGKSWYLMHSATTAMQWGLNVLYVSLEMPKTQVLRRLWTGLSGRPKQDKKVRIPHFYENEAYDGRFSIDYTEMDRKGFEPTKEKLQEWRYNWKKYYRRGSLRVESMPNSSVQIRELLAYFESLSYYDDYSPDVIVLDYADLLLSPEREKRLQLDDIWRNLRRYAMEKNICIVTASQSGRAAAKGDSDADNISEAITKVAHVTKLIAINATKAERAAGVVRVANVAEREGGSTFDQAVVLQCLDIGQPVIDSRFVSEVVMIREGGHDGDRT